MCASVWGYQFVCNIDSYIIRELYCYIRNIYNQIENSACDESWDDPVGHPIGDNDQYDLVGRQIFAAISRAIYTT